MRDYALTLLIPAAMLWGLTKTRRAMMVLAWICFMRPYDFSWGLWNHVPTFLIALAFAILSALIHNGFKFNPHPFLLLYLTFLAWAGITCFTAFVPGIAWDFYKYFFESFWVVPIFVFGTLRNLNTVKWVLLVSAASLTLVGFKVGLALSLSGGSHVTDQINGFVGDNNVFGLTLLLAIATCMGLRRVFDRSRWKFVFLPVIGYALLAVIYTESRGAFISLALIFTLSALASKNPIRNIILLGLFSYLGYAVIPGRFFHRLDTFQDIQNDDSAMHRVEYWNFGLRMAASRPVFGVGLNNFKAYTDDHFKQELEGRYSQVAHNVYIEVLAETGYPGLILYLAMVLWTLVALHRLYRRAKRTARAYPDLRWVSSTAFWMRNGWIGYLLGSTFLNMLVLDFPWYFMWYAHLLALTFDRELFRRRRVLAGITAKESEKTPAHAPAPKLAN